MSEPISGNHNDIYDMERHLGELTAKLERASIPANGLFLNMDAGFDYHNWRNWLRNLAQLFVRTIVVPVYIHRAFPTGDDLLRQVRMMCATVMKCSLGSRESSAG